MSTEITVLTFNIWGIFDSKHRASRMAHFASKIEEFDVILLQEQFSESDFELIVRHLPNEVRKTRFFRRFPSAFYGSGIAVISRFPIKQALFFTFPLQGYPERIFHGDYYANKGIAFVHISIPCNLKKKNSDDNDSDIFFEDVLLYTTHFVAMYQKSAHLSDWRDELYLSVRLSQAISSAEFISATSRPTDRIIFGGDFNSPQRSLELKTMFILLRQRGYHFSSVLPSPNNYRSHLSEEDGRTSDIIQTFSDANLFNTTNEGWFLQGDDLPSQIDHIFFTHNTLRLCTYEDCPYAANNYPFYMQVDGEKVPTGVVVFTQNDEVSVELKKNFFIRFKELFFTRGRRETTTSLSSLSSRIIMCCCPLSDHYGVAARFRLETKSPINSEEELRFNQTTMTVELTGAEKEVLQEALRFFDVSVKKMRRGSNLCLLFATAIATCVFANIFFLLCQGQQQEQHTERVLEQLFHVASLAGNAKSNKGVLSLNTSELWKRWMGKLNRNKQETYTPTMTTRAEETTFIEGNINFAHMATKLHEKSFWHILSPVVIILGTLLSSASFVTALLQRNANAKVMSEQLNVLRRACPLSDNEYSSGETQVTASS